MGLVELAKSLGHRLAPGLENFRAVEHQDGSYTLSAIHGKRRITYHSNAQLYGLSLWDRKILADKKNIPFETQVPAVVIETQEERLYIQSGHGIFIATLQVLPDEGTYNPTALIEVGGVEIWNGIGLNKIYYDSLFFKYQDMLLVHARRMERGA